MSRRRCSSPCSCSPPGYFLNAAYSVKTAAKHHPASAPLPFFYPWRSSQPPKLRRRHPKTSTPSAINFSNPTCRPRSAPACWLIGLHCFAMNRQNRLTRSRPDNKPLTQLFSAAKPCACRRATRLPSPTSSQLVNAWNACPKTSKSPPQPQSRRVHRPDKTLARAQANDQARPFRFNAASAPASASQRRHRTSAGRGVSTCGLRLAIPPQQRLLARLADAPARHSAPHTRRQTMVTHGEL